MRSHITLFLTIIVVGLVTAQNNNSKICKAMLQVDPIIETTEKTHYIFTGSDTTGLNVKMTKITIMEGRTEMVKRRDKNCTKPNILDCYINVIEEVPPVTMNLYTLAGPDVTTEYDTRKEKVQVVRREAGQQEVDIVCTKNRSKSLINKIQTALIAQGYPLTVNGTLDQATNLSISDFQKSKSLAYGDLTLETLAALGIK